MLRCHAGEQVGGDAAEAVLLVAAGSIVALTATARSLIVALRPAVLSVLGLPAKSTGSVPVGTASRPIGRVAACRKLSAIELHAPHPLDSFFTLNALLFAGLQDLFVLDAELATGYIVAIQCDDDGVGLVRVTEVCEGESTEDAIVVMVIKGIRQGCLETLLYVAC